MKQFLERAQNDLDVSSILQTVLFPKLMQKIQAKELQQRMYHKIPNYCNSIFLKTTNSISNSFFINQKVPKEPQFRIKQSQVLKREKWHRSGIRIQHKKKKISIPLKTIISGTQLRIPANENSKSSQSRLNNSQNRFQKLQIEENIPSEKWEDQIRQKLNLVEIQRKKREEIELKQDLALKAKIKENKNRKIAFDENGQLILVKDPDFRRYPAFWTNVGSKIEQLQRQKEIKLQQEISKRSQKTKYKVQEQQLQIKSQLQKQSYLFNDFKPQQGVSLTVYINKAHPILVKENKVQPRKLNIQNLLDDPNIKLSFQQFKSIGNVKQIIHTATPFNEEEEVTKKTVEARDYSKVEKQRPRRKSKNKIKLTRIFDQIVDEFKDSLLEQSSLLKQAKSTKKIQIKNSFLSPEDKKRQFTKNQKRPSLYSSFKTRKVHYGPQHLKRSFF